jgi:hypothetical protein
LISFTSYPKGISILLSSWEFQIIVMIIIQRSFTIEFYLLAEVAVIIPFWLRQIIVMIFFLAFLSISLSSVP